LETHFEKIPRKKKTLVQKLSIRRSAVPRVIRPNVQVRIDVHANPGIPAEYFGHRAAVGVRNIVAAAEYYQSFTVLEKDLDNFDQPIVNRFQFT
jgi:hypothetical protein